jgi:hypothetical protein
MSVICDWFVLSLKIFFSEDSETMFTKFQMYFWFFRQNTIFIFWGLILEYYVGIEVKLDLFQLRLKFE